MKRQTGGRYRGELSGSRWRGHVVDHRHVTPSTARWELRAVRKSWTPIAQ